MKILLCNDDGISSAGLLALYRSVSDLGEVFVVAPESGQSAVGHSVTLDRPISCRRVHVHESFWGYAVDGRPADCVKLALVELLPDRPDLLVSGINAGANVGINVLYSGTVAAAAEGALFGIPSVAVSLEMGQELDFEWAARIARKVLDRLLQSGMPPGALFNVNIPARRPGVPRGVRLARQSTMPMADRFRKSEDSGKVLYWLEGDFADCSDGPETDLHALRQGYVAVTPLKFDLTDETRLRELRSRHWPEQL